MKKSLSILSLLWLMYCVSSNSPAYVLHIRSIHDAALVPRRCFNDYQKWFVRQYDPTDKKIDVTITVRLRAFGNREEKEAAWDAEWRKKHPDWGPVPLGAAVSSRPAEVWMDLKENGRGNLMLPPQILGHGVSHAVGFLDAGPAEPSLIRIEQDSAEYPQTCFNNYQSWFETLYPTLKKMDVTVTVRLRAFGYGKEKWAAWNEEWGKAHPDWELVRLGMTVSSHPVQVWMDLRQDKEGHAVLPPHVLGHEMEHAIILQDARLEDPHLVTETYIYDRQ